MAAAGQRRPRRRLAGDHAAVVQLAAAARRTPGPVDPKLAALALQQQARGHARLGEHRDCYALLDMAAGTLDGHPDVTVPGAPAYLQKYDLRTLTEQSASCYQVTGQADRAVTILEETIAGTSPAPARDRGTSPRNSPSPSPPPAGQTRPGPAPSDWTPSPPPARPAPPAFSANSRRSASASPPSGRLTPPPALSARH